jgi:hypothetical protein
MIDLPARCAPDDTVFMRSMLRPKPKVSLSAMSSLLADHPVSIGIPYGWARNFSPMSFAHALRGSMRFLMYRSLSVR